MNYKAHLQFLITLTMSNFRSVAMMVMIYQRSYCNSDYAYNHNHCSDNSKSNSNNSSWWSTYTYMT